MRLLRLSFRCVAGSRGPSQVSPTWYRWMWRVNLNWRQREARECLSWHETSSLLLKQTRGCVRVFIWMLLIIHYDNWLADHLTTVAVSRRPRANFAFTRFVPNVPITSTRVPRCYKRYELQLINFILITIVQLWLLLYSNRACVSCVSKCILCLHFELFYSRAWCYTPIRDRYKIQKKIIKIESFMKLISKPVLSL